MCASKQNDARLPPIIYHMEEQREEQRLPKTIQEGETLQIEITPRKTNLNNSFFFGKIHLLTAKLHRSIKRK